MPLTFCEYKGQSEEYSCASCAYLDVAVCERDTHDRLLRLTAKLISQAVMSGRDALSNTCTRFVRRKQSSTRLINLPEELLLQALIPGSKAPNSHWVAPDCEQPWLTISPETRIAHWPLFQTCRQLRDLVLKHHNGLIVNIPARPGACIASEVEYWQHFELGCKALSRALDTSTQHSLENVGLTVQTLRKKGTWQYVPDDKSWGNTHGKLIANNVQLHKLHILKLKGMQLPESFFLVISQFMPCLRALTLCDVQFEIQRSSVSAAIEHAPPELPLQQLNLTCCSFRECNSGRQIKFDVKPENLVKLPSLHSFVFATNTLFDKQPERCLWEWLMSAVDVQQISSISLRYESILNVHKLLPYELESLKAFKQLTCIKLDFSINDDLMAILLNMSHLRQAELRIDNAKVIQDYSQRIWLLEKLVLNTRVINKQWITSVRRLLLNSPQLVEVACEGTITASGGYLITLDNNQVPEFLEIARNIKWPASLGEYTNVYTALPSETVLLLPYVSYLDIQYLHTKVEEAWAVEAQHRAIAVRCWGEPDLPVLLQRKDVFVLGPTPALPIGPVETWDLDKVWELLVNHRRHMLMLYHWSDKQGEYGFYEQGFRRTALNHELLSSALGLDRDYPKDTLSILLRCVIRASNPRS